MNKDSLETYLNIVKTRSFTKTAEYMFISQSAVSNRLVSLENELGVKLCGLLLGDKVEGLAKELAGYGADEIIVCEHPLLKDYTTDAYAKVICDCVVEMKP